METQEVTVLPSRALSPVFTSQWGPRHPSDSRAGSAQVVRGTEPAGAAGGAAAGAALEQEEGSDDKVPWWWGFAGQVPLGLHRFLTALSLPFLEGFTSWAHFRLFIPALLPRLQTGQLGLAWPGPSWEKAKPETGPCAQAGQPGRDESRVQRMDAEVPPAFCTRGPAPCVSSLPGVHLGRWTLQPCP